MKHGLLQIAVILLLASAPAYGQQVTGKITDADNSVPLPGVSILVKGTNTGSTTDADGKFSVAVPDIQKTVLVFSFIGYTTLEIPVNGQTEINLSMSPDITQLEEVVVVGYGEKKRANLTGAVGSVGSEALESRPITNTMAALQGVLPGLTIQRASGQPGNEDFSFNVRGVSSMNGTNAPLLLVDGVAVENLNLLNPADIESISVLKDAQASIYGARAASGVILVTTKKGKKGAPAITYSTNVAISKLAGMMDTPNNYQFALMDNEANIHNGSAPMYTPDLLERVRTGDPNPIPHPVYGSSGWMLFFTDTDWRKAVFENGFQHKHTMTFSGGGENSTYYLSGTYADQRGVIKYGDDNNKRYNLRLNYDYDFSKRLRLESKITLENQNRTDIGGAGSAGVMYETIFGMPNHPVYTQSGEKYFAQGGWGNAVAQAKEAATATFDTRNVNTNFKLIYTVADGLKLNLQSGINYRSIDNKDIGKPHPLYTWDESSIAYYSIANPEQSWVSQRHENNVYRNFQGYLQYGKVLNDKHEIDIMGGASHEENDLEWITAGRSNFPTDEVWALGVGQDNMINDGGGTHWAIRSVFSRLSYAFNSKYMLEANLRYDGSSQFDQDTRWGFFPGVSVGWRLSEENFIRDLGLFDNLKLRASYGETGNLTAIPELDYYQLINLGRTWPDPKAYPYPFGEGQQSQSAYLAGMVSPDRTWETLATTNAGLDVTVLSSKLDFSFDYFVKRNIDMLIQVAYPSLLGAKPPTTNAGEMMTWGFETSLGWKDRIGDFQYSARVMLSDAKNEMTNLGGQDTYVLGLNGPANYNNAREGYSLNTYFAYQFDGLIRTQEELDTYKLLGGVPLDIGIGDAKFKDLNGDGKISLYSDTPGQDGDVVNAGNTFPRYTYGVNIEVKWKNFDLGIFLQGVGKRTLFRVGEYSMPWSDWWRQPPAYYYGKTWNEDRPDAEYPRLSHGNIRNWNYQASTLQEVDASYLRLKNLQIGYTLPQKLISKVSVSSARVYFSGFDLWEMHNVKGGWDPESSTTGFNYPFQRLYSFGLDITF
jgi:TonB-linked SusC/RagA family outer membrane protein